MFKKLGELMQVTASTHTPTTPFTPAPLDPDIVKVKLVCCGCFAAREEQGEHPLKKCAACKSVWYCNERCQKTAWTTHKLVCNKPNFDTDKVKSLSGIKGYIPPTIPGKEENVCRFKEADGTVRWMTQGEFQDKMGVTYTPRPLGTQAVLLQVSGEVYSSNTVASPDAVAIERQGNMGYGLVALTDIPKGSAICYFGCVIEPLVISSKALISGKYRPNSAITEDRKFVFKDNDYASKGICINDGPANTKVSIGDCAVIALRDIKANDPIFINYGPTHHQKKGLYELSERGYQIALEICKDNLNEEPFFSIIWTPRIIAEIFLRGDMSNRVKKTLSNQLEIKNIKFEQNAPMMLTALSLIIEEERKEYAKVLGQMTQQSLLLLCKYMNETKSVPPVDQFVIMGKIMDQIIFLMKGTLNGDLWVTHFTEFHKNFSSDRVEKIRAFENKKLPEKLDDGTVIPQLPAPIIDYCSRVPAQFWPQINELRQLWFMDKLQQVFRK